MLLQILFLQDPWNPKLTHPITPTTACKKPAANMALKEWRLNFLPIFGGTKGTETHPSWEFQHLILEW